MTATSSAAANASSQWRLATVAEVISETPETCTLVLDVADWPGHSAGQHVDVRLTAPDGYQAQRSYSIASPPEDARLRLTVERLNDGEVSSYLCGEARVGDQFELRGPIGGYFVWRTRDVGPLLLICGGSGIVPLMAMLRHRALALRSPRERQQTPARLLYSSRTWDDVIFRDELTRMASDDASLEVVHTITREPPPDWTGFRKRIDREILTSVAWPPAQGSRIFVCGPTPLVESVATDLVNLGHDASSVKTERFGPTG